VPERIPFGPAPLGQPVGEIGDGAWLEWQIADFLYQAELFRLSMQIAKNWGIAGYPPSVPTADTERFS
jgi:hypothetical protein